MYSMTASARSWKRYGDRQQSFPIYKYRKNKEQGMEEERLQDVVTLRPLDPSDIDLMMELVNDQRVTRYLPGMITDRKMMEGWVSSLGKVAHEYVVMAGDQEIGECSLDIYGETAEAGPMLLPDHWGQGYGTKVLELLKDIACGSNVTAMRATTDRKNTAAVRLLMKSGYQQQKSGWMVRISDEGDDLSEGQEILLFARKI